MTTTVMNVSGKRQVKRPMGTRVCAPWQDGIYYPGIIRSNRSSLKSRLDSSYTVIFDDGYCRDYPANQIVGPNFQNTNVVHLKFNQRVFITHKNGSESSGHVQKHKKQTNEVFIKLEDVSETLIQRKLDEVRLLPERRKGGKMVIEQQGNHHHHQKLTNVCPDVKRKAPVNIEVPSAKSPKVEDEPLMDDVMAAMVLTSLSASPLGGNRSRHNSNESNASSISDIQLPTSPRSPTSRCFDSFSPSSSGHFSWDMHSRGTPSPVSSTSDAEYPIVHPGSMIFGPPSVDEGIDVSEPGALCIAENTPIQNMMATIKTLYKCTWPGCGKTLCTVQGIEKHIRTLHLRKKELVFFSDHEEEFYYTEIETTVDTVSDTFANMYTSTPSPINTPVEDPYCFESTPTPSVRQDEGALCERLSPLPLQRVDEICQQQNMQQLQNTQQQYTVVTPVLISPSQPQQTSFAWPTVPTTQFTRFQATPQATPSSPPTPPHHPTIIRHKQSLVEQRQHQHQAASPKTNQHFVIPPKALGSPVHTKIRSEGKKCRKVYGMDNRDMWCTQCRWKKACVRFT